MDELWQVKMLIHQNLTVGVYLFNLVLVCCNLTTFAVNATKLAYAFNCRPHNICMQAFSTN